jgi:hypothetical protein
MRELQHEAFFTLDHPMPHDIESAAIDADGARAIALPVKYPD